MIIRLFSGQEFPISKEEAEYVKQILLTGNHKYLELGKNLIAVSAIECVIKTQLDRPEFENDFRSLQAPDYPQLERGV